MPNLSPGGREMSKWVVLGALLLFVSSPSLAQGPTVPVPRVPVAELYGGYAYTHFSAGGYGTSEHGAIGSFGWNVKPWLQIVADTSYNQVSANGTKTVLYGNHYGARVLYRERNTWRASPFAEVLLGSSHARNTVGGTGGFQISDTSFSTKAGGGLDLNITPHFAIRAFDVDYYRTSLFGAHQNNLWASAGIVLRIGGARPQ